MKKNIYTYQIGNTTSHIDLSTVSAMHWREDIKELTMQIGCDEVSIKFAEDFSYHSLISKWQKGE